MAYYTFPANDFAAIAASIRGLCAAHGFTSHAGNIMQKGTLFVTVGAVGQSVRIYGGAGMSGAALTDASSTYVQIMAVTHGANPSFPVTCHVHINDNPDEVFIAVNYNGAYWQWLAFGQSNMASVLPGSGNWIAGTFGQDAVASAAFLCGHWGAAMSGFGGIAGGPTGRRTGAGMFNMISGGARSVNSRIHTGYNAAVNVGWSSIADSNTVENECNAIMYQEPLLTATPNMWNQQTVLVPVVVTSRAPDQKWRVVARMQHIRYCRNDFHPDGDIIDFAGDQWKVYPFFRRNIDARSANGGPVWSRHYNPPVSNVAVEHTGTFAHAIRYTP